jgi:hypothetical protein
LGGAVAGILMNLETDGAVAAAAMDTGMLLELLLAGRRLLLLGGGHCLGACGSRGGGQGIYRKKFYRTQNDPAPQSYMN